MQLEGITGIISSFPQSLGTIIGKNYDEKQFISSATLFNLRPSVCGCLNTPLRFFWYTLLGILYPPSLKILDPGHLRSGHQVTSSDLTS